MRASDSDLRPHVRRPQRVRALRATDAHADGWAARRRSRDGRLTVFVDAETREGLVRLVARHTRRTPVVMTPYVWSRDRRVYFTEGDWLVIFEGGEVYRYSHEQFVLQFEEESDG